MKNHAIKWLYQVTGRKKLSILFLIIVQALHGASGVFYALMMRNLVDSAVDRNMSGFYCFAAAMILLVLMQIAMRAVIRFLEEYTRSSLENIFKQRLLTHILHKDYAAVTAVHSGEWQNRLTNDSVLIANHCVEILPGMAGMAVKMISAMIMILILDRRFAVILIPAGIILLITSYGFRKTLKKLHKNVQEKDGSLRIFLQERLGSLMMIRSFAAEKPTESEAAEKMSDHKAARMQKNRFSNICNICFNTGMQGMYLIGVVYCAYGILIGRITYGTLTAVTQLISQIQSPFANITGYLPKFYAMTASAERLMEIECFADESTETPMEISEIRSYYRDTFSALCLQDAEFTYLPISDKADLHDKTGMPTVLDHVSLIIRKGEYVAFTGHSGCGKSTVLKLLMCIYKLDRGKQYVTEMSGNSQTLSSAHHRLFAYVPQGNHLMSGTIRSVVAFADQSRASDNEQIRNALKIACAEEFVSELEQGIDTLLGERGTGLSEGQMQRIAIARAVFSQSPILLLDEATSALDEATEQRVLKNLRMMTDKTVVIVTHRPAALEVCDRVLEFTEEGVIEKNG